MKPEEQPAAWSEGWVADGLVTAASISAAHRPYLKRVLLDGQAFP